MCATSAKELQRIIGVANHSSGVARGVPSRFSITLKKAKQERLDIMMWTVVRRERFGHDKKWLRVQSSIYATLENQVWFLRHLAENSASKSWYRAVPAQELLEDILEDHQSA